MGKEINKKIIIFSILLVVSIALQIIALFNFFGMSFILVPLITIIFCYLVHLIDDKNKHQRYQKAIEYYNQNKLSEAKEIFSTLGNYKDSLIQLKKIVLMCKGDFGAIVRMDNLTTFTIPKDVHTIINEAFCNCSSLASIEIPNSVTSIGEYAFYNCRSLTSIEIPNSVTSIGERAFYDCASLTSIEIPNSVTSIGDYAFRYCCSLTSVTIGNSVTSIGKSAFNYCLSLKNIKYNGTKAEWERISKGIDWDYGIKANYVTCSDGVVYI